MINPVGVATSDAEARGPNSALVFSAVVLALAVIWLVSSYGYVEDDAYIHLDYARSVAQGNGFTFNGVLANGDTSPLWVLLLNVPHALGLEWVPSAKLLCALGIGGALLAIVRLLDELPGCEVKRHRVALAAVAVTVFNPYFVNWSFSGMEAVTAFGVSLWIVRGVFVGQATWPRLLSAAALIAVGPLLRPEFLLLGGLTGPVVVWRAWHLSQRQAPLVRAAGALALAALMVLPLIAWSAYALHAFGTVMPNTNLAKQGGSLLQLAPRLASVYIAGFPVTLALLPALFVRPALLRGIPPAIWVLLLWPVLCVLFYLVDHTVVQTRYCLLSMPCLSIAVLWLLQNSGRSTWFNVVVVAMLAASFLTNILAVVPLVANKADGARAYTELSAYLRDRVPRNEPIAVYAIGLPGFKSGHPLVDIGGITQPGVIPYLGDPPAVVRWAREQGARYYVGAELPEPGAIPLFTTSVRYLGWTFSHSQQLTTAPLVLYKLPENPQSHLPDVTRNTESRPRRPTSTPLQPQRTAALRSRQCVQPGCL
jgi:hypothetical protein